MNFVRAISTQLSFLIIFGLVQNVYSFNNYKWIPLKTGDKIPGKSVYVYHSIDRFIGRARHFNEILPAEIHANGTAYITSCSKKIRKHKFEILTIVGDLEWKEFSYIKDIDETVVRVGQSWNNEPIFIAVQSLSYYSPNDYHIVSVYLASKKFDCWSDFVFDRDRTHKFLSLEPASQWIDVSVMDLPNNTVSGGKSDEDHEIYVARLKHNCEVVVGEANSQMGTATAILNNNSDIEDVYCQVLVGEPLEYSWVAASDGEIPDNAIVSGQDGNELSYIVRINKTIGHLTYAKAFREKLDYDILVMNDSNEEV